MSYAFSFDPDAANDTNARVYALARRGTDQVLDIGPRPAVVAIALAQADGRKVTQVGPGAPGDEESAAAFVSTVDIDLDSAEWHASLGGQTFPTVIVRGIEAFRDPARLLADLHRYGLLGPAGNLVLPLHNANHQSVLAGLFAGEARYEHSGRLDAAQNRWFTLDSITRLLEEHGYTLVEVHRIVGALEDGAAGHRLRDLSEAALAGIAELGLEGRTTEYVLLARPLTAESRLRELHEQLDEIRSRLEVEQREVLGLRHQLRETQALLVDERKRVLAEMAEGARELTALRDERDDALRRLKQAQNRPVPERRPRGSKRIRAALRKADRLSGGLARRVLRKARANARRGRGSGTST